MPGVRHDSDIEEFAVKYKDLSVGWKFINKLVELDMDFPAFVSGDDLYLYDAYLHVLDPSRYRQEHIAMARYIASDHAMHAPVNALLMCSNMTYKSMAAELGIAEKALIAYEKLFFNVIDRHMDHMFIRNVVYPDGRLVEMYENYLENEDLGRLLMRAGYNNGKDDVMHFAGFRSGLLDSLANQNMPVKLESVIMANGYILAKNGWANQRDHAVGVISARNLIAAAKHGGQDQQQDNAFARFGEVLIDEIIDVKGAEAESRPMLAQRLGIH